MKRPSSPSATESGSQPVDPTVTPPARTDGRSDGLEEKKPIKIFRAGENAGGDDRSTAASTRT
jgi:hypothetical protein